jgi:hypothetical protein
MTPNVAKVGGLQRQDAHHNFMIRCVILLCGGVKGEAVVAYRNPLIRRP